MDLKEILKNTIPNPLSEQSTLSNLDKKTLLIEEGWSFTTLIRNVLFLLIAAFVLVVHFKISASIVVILVGTEVLITAATGYIRFRKIKSINAIETLDNAKSYRNLLITSEYYELIKAIFGFVANGVSVVLILLLFSRIQLVGGLLCLWQHPLVRVLLLLHGLSSEITQTVIQDLLKRLTAMKGNLCLMGLKLYSLIRKTG